MAEVGEEVRAHLAAHGGVTTTARLQAMGVSPAQICRLLTSGILVRLRRSTFLDGERWRAAQPWERHELRARAVAADLNVSEGEVMEMESRLSGSDIGFDLTADEDEDRGPPAPAAPARARAPRPPRGRPARRHRGQDAALRLP